MSFVGSNILAGASGQGDAGYKIERSLRFNSGDTPYLTRAITETSTFTYSAWFKRCSSSRDDILVAGSSTGFYLYFHTDGTIKINTNSANIFTSNGQYRDPSAWYNICFSNDGSTFKLYVNGVLDKTVSLTTKLYTGDLWISKGGSSDYADYYLAEAYLIDGQVLTPTDFGKFDDNNVWQPKKYTGTYSSTNTSTSLSQVGWNPSTTAAGNHTLIWDGSTSNKAYGYAGNSIGTVSFNPPLTNVTKVECYTQDYNHYLNGSSISTPETVNGGWHTYYDNSSTPITLNSLGNAYSNNTQTVDLAAIRINGSHIIDSQTWTPPSGSGIGVQDTGANSFYLKFADNSSNAALGTDSSGKNNTFTVHNLMAAAPGLETAKQGMDVITYTGNGTEQQFGKYKPSENATVVGGTLSNAGNAFNGSGSNWATLAATNTSTAAHVDFAVALTGITRIEAAFDSPSGSGDTRGRYNGSNAGNTRSGTSSGYSDIYNGSAITVTSVGFAINQNSQTGTSSDIVSRFRITDSQGTRFILDGTGSGLNFQPDFVWIKGRNWAGHNSLADSVRGAGKVLYSNLTNAEATNDSMLTAFNSDGFSVGSDNDVNKSGSNYVAWCWRAGGSVSSNSNGSITSSVSVNNTYGFSVVSYNGDNNNGDTVGHGLSTAPKWIIVKSRADAYTWYVYHHEVGATKYLRLDTTGAETTGSGAWSNNAPTSTVFYLGQDNAVNDGNKDYIAYCWSEISGFSKFSKYTGNGNSNGPVVTTGFKPRYLMVKRTDSSNNWAIFDSARSLDNDLKANTSEVEGSAPMAFLDDGFQPKNTYSSTNTNGGTYIYMAFADMPPNELIDSLIDTPTNYTATPNSGGNYATLNPLNKHNTADTFSEGNLKLTSSGSGAGHFGRGTIAMSSGKYYWEVTWNDTSHNFVGIQGQSDINYNNSYIYLSNAKASNTNGSSEGSSYGESWGNGDIIGVAYDADNATLAFYKNGVSQGTAFTDVTGTSSPYPDGYVPFFGNWNNQVCTFNVNFGQRPFAYTPPTGYKSLCTTNLPDPTIEDPSTAFDVKTFVSNNGNSKSISLGFSPDLVWTKSRANAYEGQIFDAVRGDDREMSTNATRADRTLAGSLTFDSAGFTMPSANNNANYGVDYASVGWAWDAGTTPSNPVGDVWSSGATKYIGIKFASASGGTVSYGQSSGSTTVEVWTSSDNANWTQQGSTQTLSTGHTLTTSDQYVYIRNSSNATFTNWYAAATNGADGHYSGSVYPSGASWSGPGYTDYDFRDDGGTLIHTGGLNSSVYDQSQDWSGGSVSGATHTGTSWADAFDGAFGTGVFTYATNTSTLTMPSGTTWSNKFEVYALKHGGTLYVNGTDVGASMSGFTTTAQWHDITSIVGSSGTLSSIGVSDVGTNYVKLFAVRLDGKLLVDSGVSVTNVPSMASTVRANPSAGFSIVSYAGNSTGGATVGHGLNSKPDLIILKALNAGENWFVNFPIGTGDGYLMLNQTNAGDGSNNTVWNSTDPTSSVFTLGTSNGVNGGYDYIAYCFAPVEGYSAFGSYTGNGSSDGPFIHTRFRVKWLLTKRSDGGANDWQLIDATRSPSNVADDVLKPNSNNAEGTHADYGVDFLSNGFKHRTGHIARNGSGNTYIYAAFAEHPFKTARAR